MAEQYIDPIVGKLPECPSCGKEFAGKDMEIHQNLAHTPADAPWRYGPLFHQTIDRDAHEIVSRGMTIGIVWHEPNAQIIAVSREMLELLEWIERGDWNDGPGSWAVLDRRVSEIIAKARGENHG